MDRNDLISRENLKIELTKQIAYFDDRANTTSIENEKYAYSHCKDGLMLARQIVDNAQTVHHSNCDNCEDKAKQYSLGFQDGYLVGNKRSQGEWTEKVERRGCFAGDKTVYSYTCPFCGVKEFKKYPFCHCGADLRGDKE